jgi:hypothetical protein
VVECAGGWLAERDRREARGRLFIKAASVQARIGTIGGDDAGVGLKSTGKGRLGTFVCGIDTTRGVQNDIQVKIRVTGG